MPRLFDARTGCALSSACGCRRSATLSHATVIRLGQVVGAAFVVLGRFEVEGDDLIVRVRTIRLDTGRSLGGADGKRLAHRHAERLQPLDPPDCSRVGPPRPSRLRVQCSPHSNSTSRDCSPKRRKPKSRFCRKRFDYPQRSIARRSRSGKCIPIRATIRTPWPPSVRCPDGDPLTRQARFLAAVSMLHLGQLQASFAEFSSLNATQRDAALLNNIGVVQLRRPASAPGGKAMAFFGEAVGVDGADADLFFNAGYASWFEGNPQGAIQWLREAVDESRRRCRALRARCGAAGGGESGGSRSREGAGAAPVVRMPSGRPRGLVAM